MHETTRKSTCSRLFKYLFILATALLIVFGVTNSFHGQGSRNSAVFGVTNSSHSQGTRYSAMPIQTEPHSGLLSQTTSNYNTSSTVKQIVGFAKSIKKNDSNTLTTKQQIVAFAQSIKKQGKTIAIAIANDAYLPLANSWLCNTKFMGVHEQVSVIVSDRTSRDKLKHNWPGVHVFYIETSQGAVSGPKDFTTVGFQRITYLRSLIIKELLLNDLDVFVFEFDAIWFRSPISEFKEKMGDGDIAVVEVGTVPGEVGVGIMYIRASATTKAVYTHMINRFDRLLNDTKNDKDSKVISMSLNDQIFLTEMAKSHFAGVRVVFLPVYIYADGHWYSTPADKRNPNPVIINNNWIVGVGSKINRAKEQTHWFWGTENQTCMDDHVRHMLKLV